MTFDDEPDFGDEEEPYVPKLRARRWIAALLALTLLALGGVLGGVLAITHGGGSGTQQRQAFVSPNGDVTLSYPASWTVSSVTPSSWILTSFPIAGSGEEGLQDGQFKIDFSVNPAGGITDVKQLGLCTSREPVTVTQCETVSINSRLFTWAESEETSESGATIKGVTIATIANAKIYRADGIVPTGPHEAEGFNAVASILVSVGIRSQS